MVFAYNYYWRKIQEGDQKSFEKLVKECYPTLCYYSLQITVNGNGLGASVSN